ncbi:MAG: hypothetical protein IJW19_05550 [Clostridia bacterium]|nr:hypothetical protein [Clostridia bacterium]
MARIKLPGYHWLVSKHEGRLVTNNYSGSLGTLPDRGCVSVRTFNYRIYIDISSSSESISDAETLIHIYDGNGTFVERKIPTDRTEGYVLCLQHSNYQYINLDGGKAKEG